MIINFNQKSTIIIGIFLFLSLSFQSLVPYSLRINISHDGRQNEINMENGITNQKRIFGLKYLIRQQMRLTTDMYERHENM